MPDTEWSVCRQIPVRFRWHCQAMTTTGWLVLLYLVALLCEGYGLWAIVQDMRKTTEVLPQQDRHGSLARRRHHDQFRLGD